MRVKVAEWGNSLGLRVPKTVAEQLGLKAGSEVEVTVEGDTARLSLVAARDSRPELTAMVEAMKRLMEQGFEPPVWIDWGPDTGAEVIDDGGYSHPSAPE